MKRLFHKKWLLAVTVVVIALSAFPVVVVELTPENCISREWVNTYRQIVLGLWELGLFMTVLIKTFTAKSKASSFVLRLIHKAIMILLTLCVFYTMLVAFLLSFSWNIEVEDYGTTVLVKQLVWKDEPQYALYQKEGPFYMRWMHPIEKYPQTPELPQPETESNAGGTVPPVETDHLPDENTDDSNPISTEESDKLKRKQIAKGMKLVAEHLPEEYTKNPDQQNRKFKVPREQYTAKGETELVVYEDEHCVRYIRYDRQSKNKQCLLYVLYSNEKATEGSYGLIDARILDIYAYSMEDETVIASGRKRWSDPGTKEYQEITGEVY